MVHKTILLVDDDAGVRRFVFALLAKGDFTVLQASDGNDALRQARAFAGEIDLLLSDFQMPGMDGIALAKQLTLERPGLQVLLMSGFQSGMLVLNEGWHFLSKPFIPSQLRSLVTGLTSAGS